MFWIQLQLSGIVVGNFKFQFLIKRIQTKQLGYKNLKKLKIKSSIVTKISPMTMVKMI